eukprot:m.39516 g.39516  ORF g.39516 m.39516 type:complete len:379 (-) comp5818_c0_seq1:285-1421(-)
MHADSSAWKRTQQVTGHCSSACSARTTGENAHNVLVEVTVASTSSYDFRGGKMKTKVDKSFGSVVTVCCGSQLRLAMSVTTVAFIGCTALVAGSAANNEATEALQYSASGWGCPFSYASNPCYSDACLEARNGGTMNQECCEEVSSYCGSSGDPACSDSSLESMFDSICSSSSNSQSAAAAAWQSLYADVATSSSTTVGAQGYFQTCPFGRPYDNPCYNETCASSADSSLTGACCDTIEKYCTEEINSDPACRNPDLGGLFFVFCNSTFFDPDSPQWVPIPKGPKGPKGGILGGVAGQAAGTAALVGVSAAAVFFVYKHHQKRRRLEMQHLLQRYESGDNAPLLAAGMVPPKYYEASASATVDMKEPAEAPPGYNTNM